MLANRKTYESCTDLPLYNFIKIVLTGNNDFLYCEPKRPWNKSFDLSDTWENIFSEYNLLTNDTQSLHILSLIKEITVINNKLGVIQSTVNFLSKDFDLRLCDLLRSMGFPFQYNPQSMNNDLRLTISTAKTMLMKRREAEVELDKLNNDDRKATEKDYDALLTQLSKYMGFRIDTKQTTVLNFINYLEAFKQDNKPQENG